ncbi:MAG: hypothetical protein U0232_00640 [Thermomicrobiales bacterium]
MRARLLARPLPGGARSLLFLGAVAFAMLATPAERPPAFTPVPVSTEAVGRFDTKIATVRNATAPTTIEIDEERPPQESPISSPTSRKPPP